MCFAGGTAEVGAEGGEEEGGEVGKGPWGAFCGYFEEEFGEGEGGEGCGGKGDEFLVLYTFQKNFLTYLSPQPHYISKLIFPHSPFKQSTTKRNTQNLPFLLPLKY